MKVKAIILTALLFLTVIVIFQNTDVVPFKLLIWEFNLSRIICLITTFLLGIATGYLLCALKKK